MKNKSLSKDELVVSSHLKNMLVKLDHLPGRGQDLKKNVWNHHHLAKVLANQVRDLRLDYQLHLGGGETEWVEPPKHLHLQADLLVQEWNGALNNKNTNSCDIPRLKKQKKLGILAHRNWEWFQGSFSYLTFCFGDCTVTPIIILWRSESEKSNSWIDPVPWWVQCPLNSWASSTSPSTLIASFYYTNYSNYPGVFSWGEASSTNRNN